MSFDVGAHAAASTSAREREANDGIFTRIAKSIRRVSFTVISVLAGNGSRSVTPSPSNVDGNNLVEDAGSSVAGGGGGGGGGGGEVGEQGVGGSQGQDVGGTGGDNDSSSSSTPETGPAAGASLERGAN